MHACYYLPKDPYVGNKRIKKHESYIWVVSNNTCDLDVLRLILVNEECCTNLKNLIIFSLMTFSWILTHKNGRIISMRMEAKVPLFGKNWT